MNKKIILAGITVLMLCQRGWADNLEIAPVTIQPGEEATVDITLENPEKEFNALQFDLTLPEGLTLKYDEDEEDYVYEVNTSRMSGKNWNFTIESVAESTTHFRFIIYNGKNTAIKETSGTLFSITIVAAPTAATGIKEGHILNQKLTIDENTSDDTEDVAVSITIEGSDPEPVVDTSIEGITIITTGTDVAIEVTDENVAGPVPTTVTEAALTYVRTLAGTAEEEKMYTVYLPYDPPTAEGLTYYALKSSSGTTLSFEAVESPEANVPYLVVASGIGNVGTSSAVNVNFNDATSSVTDENDGYEMFGTLRGMTNEEAADAGAYILQSGGTWGKVTTANTGAYIPPFCAYIVKKGGGTGARLRSVIGKATGISAVKKENGNAQWYTLDGRKLTGEPSQQGVYVKEGKKVIK